MQYLLGQHSFEHTKTKTENRRYGPMHWTTMWTVVGMTTASTNTPCSNADHLFSGLLVARGHPIPPHIQHVLGTPKH